jgi:hypothetical protein
MALVVLNVVACNVGTYRNVCMRSKYAYSHVVIVWGRSDSLAFDKESFIPEVAPGLPKLWIQKLKRL